MARTSGKIVAPIRPALQAPVMPEFGISGAFSFVLSFCVKRKDKIKKIK
jgi:hypothetical protein